jgi:hypothetical protein
LHRTTFLRAAGAVAAVGAAALEEAVVVVALAEVVVGLEVVGLVAVAAAECRVLRLAQADRPPWAEGAWQRGPARASAGHRTVLAGPHGPEPEGLESRDLASAAPVPVLRPARGHLPVN